MYGYTIYLPIHLFYGVFFKKNYYYYCLLAMLHGMWYLSSLTRDQTHVPYIGSSVS